MTEDQFYSALGEADMTKKPKADLDAMLAASRILEERARARKPDREPQSRPPFQTEDSK